ncbi:hypothetical protein [Bacillus thuringiensis]|uniref:hypothetical protein n=1 Tax=Bacillus thuringiensis TaxID=1428 RepID=UPI0021D64CA5|nr:hypothetical protein [Bacillus thuringiensis]MCU7668022.1 hypothetical protein [Bacillus thuringiensis]
MKAFKVHYDTADTSTNGIVLVEDESELEEALAQKDDDFDVESAYSRITYKCEVPLSTVMVKDLSVVELLKLMSK